MFLNCDGAIFFLFFFYLSGGAEVCMNKVLQPAVNFGHMMSAELSPWQQSRLSSGEDGEM